MFNSVLISQCLQLFLKDFWIRIKSSSLVLWLMDELNNEFHQNFQKQRKQLTDLLQLHRDARKQNLQRRLEVQTQGLQPDPCFCLDTHTQEIMNIFYSAPSTHYTVKLQTVKTNSVTKVCLFTSFDLSKVPLDFQVFAYLFNLYFPLCFVRTEEVVYLWPAPL